MRTGLQSGRIAIAVAFAATLFPAPVATAYAPRDGNPPAAPILVSPINGATVTSAPILTWQPAGNAREYSVEVWRAGLPDSGVCTVGGATLAARCVEDLPPGNYEWNVTALDINGSPGGISATGMFTRATPSIAAPALLSPANGATLDYPDAVGVLRWSPAAGASRYLLQVSTSPTFAEGATDLHYANGELTADIPLQHIGVPQYWRVRGVNAARTWGGPWSPTRSFTVTWSDVPSPVSPANGAAASNIVLTWTPVKGATNYDVQVTTIGDTDFSDAIDTTPSWPSAHWTAWGDIPAGDLRWRVRARNGHWGRTAWSPARTIDRDAGAPTAPSPDPIAPPDVALIAPADDAVFPAGTDVVLSWTPVAGAIGYELDIRSSTGPWWSPGLVVGAAPVRWRFDPGATFGWRVRSLGENEQRGAWSVERQVTISAAPSVPLVSPASGGDVPKSAAFVSWQPVAGVSNYWVDVDDDPDFEDWNSNSYAGAGSNISSLPLTSWPAGRWYWRVRGGLAGIEAMSEVRAIDIVDDLAPLGEIEIVEAPWTAQTGATVQVRSVDPGAKPTQLQLSANGTTWETFALPEHGALSVAWSLTSAAHGGPSPGQRHVHARFRDAAGNWSAISSASIWYGMETPTDDTGPAGTVSVADGAAYSPTRNPLIDIPATDTHGVTLIALSTDGGATWVQRPYWPEQQVTLSASNGTKTVRVKWRDWFGNWSAEKSDSIVLDTVAPTATAPTHAFVSGSTVGSGATSMRFSWSGSDVTSGIARYEAALSTDGGAYSTISTSLSSASLTRALAGGHTYRLRVRPIDKAGNAGSWIAGPTFTVTAYQENASKLVYTGTWTRPSSSSYWGGSVKAATAAGAKASITFTGRGYAWIGCVGPTRGSARIYVNGTLVKTISTYAATTSCRKVLTTLSWSTAASRKVSIVVSGSSGHPRIDVDAIVVWN